MENYGDLNAISALLIFAAAILLVLWAVWAIRLFLCRRNLKQRNALLLKRLEEIRQLQRRCAGYEDILDSYRDPALSEEAGFVATMRDYRKLVDSVRQSRIYRNSVVSKDELISLTRLEKKDFDAMFKDNSPIQNISDWLDSFRLEEAIPLLCEMKAGWKAGAKGSADVSDVKDSSADGKDKENRREAGIGRIQNQTGFKSRKQLNKACKRIIGISLHELMAVI